MTEWENAGQRVVLPEGLLASLTLPISVVLRWDAAKYLDVVTRHVRDMDVVANLSVYLDGWRIHGEEVVEYLGNQRILFQDEYGR